MIIRQPYSLCSFSYLFAGLIQNAEQRDIDIVKNLVVDYISEPRTIILVTIPAGGQRVFVSEYENLTYWPR